jgi:hypothetical protein
MEALNSCKMPVDFYQTTQHYVTEESTLILTAVRTSNQILKRKTCHMQQSFNLMGHILFCDKVTFNRISRGFLLSTLSIASRMALGPKPHVQWVLGSLSLDESMEITTYFNLVLRLIMCQAILSHSYTSWWYFVQTSVTQLVCHNVFQWFLKPEILPDGILNNIGFLVITHKHCSNVPSLMCFKFLD